MLFSNGITCIIYKYDIFVKLKIKIRRDVRSCTLIMYINFGSQMLLVLLFILRAIALAWHSWAART